MINGTTIEYFECRRGFRKEDPLSPYLFILVADGLNKMISQGIWHGHLSDLGPILNNTASIIYPQCADDTLLFVKACSVIIKNLPWLFIVFEGVYGLKVNFAKIKLNPLNIYSAQTEHFFQILKFKIGKLPIKYLGGSYS